MINIPLCAFKIFLLKTALYWNFIKEDFGMGFTVFQEKINRWVCLVISELNVVFHWYALSEILFKSLLISSVEILMLFTIEKIDVSSAKGFYVWYESVRKIIYVYQK